MFIFSIIDDKLDRILRQLAELHVRIDSVHAETKVALETIMEKMIPSATTSNEEDISNEIEMDIFPIKSKNGVDEFENKLRTDQLYRSNLVSDIYTHCKLRQI